MTNPYWEVFFTDLDDSDDDELCEASGFERSPVCTSELLVVVLDSTVVLGAGAGVGDDSGAGAVTTTGAGGVC